MVPDAILERKL